MSTQPVLYKIIAAIIVITVLSGCSLSSTQAVPTAAPVLAPTAAAPTDTLAPTVDQNLANTQAAQTAAANQTMNAPSETPVTPTAVTPTAVPPTSTIAATPTITLTFTPVPPTAFPTNTWIPWTLTPVHSPTTVWYSCSVTSTTPAATDTLKINTTFNWTWVILNTGGALWGQHSADIEYVSGTTMQTGSSQYDLTKDVHPGDSYTTTIAMGTPSSIGTYTATWEIIQDGVQVCTLPVSVKVTN